jgi:Pectate lyase superfamily protein
VTTINVWPNPPRTTVTLSDGYVITSAGATVNMDEFILADEVNNLVRATVLATEDPNDTGLPPSVILDGNYQLTNEAANVRGFGVVADGTTDDYAAMASAVTSAQRSSLVVGPGTVKLSSALQMPASTSMRGNGRGTVLTLTASSFPANQANLSARGPAPSATELVVSGAIAHQQRVFTISNPTALAAISVGDDVTIFLGQDPYDPNEALMRWTSTVEAKTSNTITVETGAPQACGDPADKTGYAHKIWLQSASASVENVVYENLTCDRTGVQDQTVVIERARNVTMRNCYVVNANGGLAIGAVENGVFEAIYFRRADRTAHATAGRMLTCVGLKNVTFRNLSAQNVDGFGIFLESQNRQVRFEDIYLGSGDNAEIGTPVIHVVGGSTGVEFKNVHIYSHALRGALNIGEASEVRTEDFYFWTPTLFFPMAQHHGRLFYNDTLYTERRTVRRQYLAPASGTVEWDICTGLLASVRFYLSSATGTTYVGLRDQDNNDVDYTTDVTAGAGGTVTKDQFIGVNVLHNRPGAADIKRLVWATSGAPSSAYLTIEVDYFTRPSTVSSSDDTISSNSNYLLRARGIHLNNQTMLTGATAPAGGTWRVGDIVWNTAPTAGGNAGWICITAGTPGTWKTFGAIAP